MFCTDHLSIGCGGEALARDTAEGDKEEEIEDQEDNKVIDTDREEMSSLCTQLTLTLRLLITLLPLIFLQSLYLSLFFPTTASVICLSKIPKQGR